MTLTQLAPPYPIFTDKSGLPLDNGYLYFGTANLNPETNPITVYYDSALTQPAAQPLRTSNGYVMRNGSPAIIYANSQFSVTVRDKKKALVIYSPVGYGILPGTTASSTDQLTYNEGSTGAVNRVLTDRLEDRVTVKDFGAVGDGVADDTAAIKAMVAAVGYFTLPEGTFKITDEITIPTGVFGAIWSGAGMGKSTLLCSGMVGKKALKVANPSALYRHTMRDFRISGDCDTCIDLTLSSTTYQVYQSEYRNLELNSAAGSAFVANFHFSCAWYNVHVNSTAGHGFDIQGGNSTVMTNCYAHNMGGAGKAGYRIKSSATLIACNGVDSGDYWGIFGSTVASDGINYQYGITMIGCNVEDFGISAIRLYYTGIFVADRVDFVPKATGTYTTIIDGSSFAGSTGTVNTRNCRVISKGATCSGASNILIFNPLLVKSTGGQFPDYYNTSASLVYPSSVETMSTPFFQVAATRFDQLDAARYWGFTSQVPSTWTANATTVSLSGRNTINTANTVATSFQTATGGVEGQRITIIVKDANTTIVNNFAAAGRFLNKSGANYVAANGSVYEYVYNGTNWVEV